MNKLKKTSPIVVVLILLGNLAYSQSNVLLKSISKLPVAIYDGIDFESYSVILGSVYDSAIVGSEKFEHPYHSLFIAELNDQEQISKYCLISSNNKISGRYLNTLANGDYVIAGEFCGTINMDSKDYVAENWDQFIAVVGQKTLKVKNFIHISSPRKLPKNDFPICAVGDSIFLALEDSSMLNSVSDQYIVEPGIHLLSSNLASLNHHLLPNENIKALLSFNGNIITISWRVRTDTVSVKAFSLENQSFKNYGSIQFMSKNYGSYNLSCYRDVLMVSYHNSFSNTSISDSNHYWVYSPSLLLIDSFSLFADFVSVSNVKMFSSGDLLVSGTYANEIYCSSADTTIMTQESTGSFILYNDGHQPNLINLECRNLTNFYESYDGGIKVISNGIALDNQNNFISASITGVEVSTQVMPANLSAANMDDVGTYPILYPNPSGTSELLVDLTIDGTILNDKIKEVIINTADGLEIDCEWKLVDNRIDIRLKRNYVGKAIVRLLSDNNKVYSYKVIFQ